MTDDDVKRGAQDDEDMLSENEQEILDEVNNEMDGNMKIAKDVRGYDDANEDQQDNDSGDDDSQANLGHRSASDNESRSSRGKAAAKKQKKSQLRNRAESGGSDVDKYIKPLRETHSRYLQYLRNIGFDKKTNVASVQIAFPLDFKKVLMLTLAEQTLTKVLVRSVPNIEKCTLIRPKKENDEPYLVV